MPRIKVTCPACGAQLNVDEKHVGKKGKCPKCGEAVKITDLGREEPPTEQKHKPPPATDRQKDFATDLGIQFDESITSREISLLIDVAVAREEELTNGGMEKHLVSAEPVEMIYELEQRGISAFMMTWDEEERRECGGVEMDVVFTGNLTMDSVNLMILLRAVALAEENKTPILSELLEIYAGN